MQALDPLEVHGDQIFVTPAIGIDVATLEVTPPHTRPAGPGHGFSFEPHRQVWGTSGATLTSSSALLRWSLAGPVTVGCFLKT
ncbi:hypothetical protein [Sphingomonas turrisvirgatae]|uniref:Uncharacterized protein n=1 Tax=Sphingomonas turrisvirgatae TaxID=1888892 RepID=A0A1E3LYQ7_9SPHN|nr:hypothetical protein [Sphingomonas turrisvirgatae]ODP38881.1 hypothetical protein BFL28_13250 [Sphingomonas turrisvirgatae]